MNVGALVPDELIIGLVIDRLKQDDCRQGYLFDGFPRTIPQAHALQAAGVSLDYVLEIDVPDEAVVERMSGRRTHPASGRSYHVKFNPPKQADIDDVTCEALVKRPDDAEETVKRRLSVYHEQTELLVGFYRTLAQSRLGNTPEYRRIPGIGSVGQIRERALAALQPRPC